MALQYTPVLLSLKTGKNLRPPSSCFLVHGCVFLCASTHMVSYSASFPIVASAHLASETSAGKKSDVLLAIACQLSYLAAGEARLSANSGRIWEEGAI
jgi:hypothetical protein